MGEVKQIQPNHADHISGYKDKWLQNMLDTECVIAQPKYDGERMLIHIDHGNIYCTSRRHSKATGKFMENQDKLPKLKEFFKDFCYDYTVVDCECYQKDWSTIVGILHSLPERAIELSKANPPYFALFDCLFFDGEDLRDKPYRQRLEKLLKVLAYVTFSFTYRMHLASFIDDDLLVNNLTEAHAFTSIDEFPIAMQNAIDDGYEGIVVKSLDKTYYEQGASLKCKKFETVDVVVCGYDVGRGKYADTIGALHVGYYDPSTQSIVKISNVNCGTDEERNMWRDKWEMLKNSVIEVKCQEVTDSSLRHPVYIRIRDDKDYTMCTRDTIFK